MESASDGKGRSEGGGGTTPEGEGVNSGNGEIPGRARGSTGVRGMRPSWASVAKGGDGPRGGGRMVSKEELVRLREVFSDALIFPKEELESTRNEWRGKTLIGKLLSRRFDSDFVAKALLYRWKPKGDVEIIPTSNGFYLFRFACEDDLVKVRSGGPTVVGGAVLALEEWRENFKPNRDTISKATVWLRMPGLPSELWKRTFVLAIANKAGRPVQIDLCTKNMLRGGFARVCVEVDLTRPLVAGTLVGPPEDQIFQEFVYEGIGLYCFRCGMIGHGVHECKCQPNELKITVVKIIDREGVFMGESHGGPGGEEVMTQPSEVVEEEVIVHGDLYGPWLAAHQRRLQRAPTIRAPTTGVGTHHVRMEGADGVKGGNRGAKVESMHIPLNKGNVLHAAESSMGLQSAMNGREDKVVTNVIKEGEKAGMHGEQKRQSLYYQTANLKEKMGPKGTGPKDRNFGRVKLVGSDMAQTEYNPHIKSFSDNGLGGGVVSSSGPLVVFSAVNHTGHANVVSKERSCRGLARAGKNPLQQSAPNRFLALETLANAEDEVQGHGVDSVLPYKGVFGMGMLGLQDVGGAIKRRRNSTPVPELTGGYISGGCKGKENVDCNVQPSDAEPMCDESEGVAGTQGAR